MIFLKPMDLAEMEQEREKGKISPELIEAYVSYCSVTRDSHKNGSKNKKTRRREVEMVKAYTIPVYSLLVKVGRREIESLPEIYRVPVAEYLALNKLNHKTPFPSWRGVFSWEL
ncbi:CD1375 family protein [Brevibacillus laterosporus]|uniref:CD1375 family protein n=1 Tax=Brevibacillus laterosporus TaxID=1465 RepID=UPI003D1DFEBF